VSRLWPMNLRPHELESERLVERLLSTLPGDLGTLRHLCAKVQDWDAILQSASKHGVLAVLYHYLTELQIALPPAVNSSLKRQLTLEWIRHLALRAAFDEAVETLRAAGVRAVALKGPLIGERLYATPFLRPSSDVDLLVAESDLDRAQNSLESLGYYGETGALARYYRENHHHIHLTRPQGPTLELHFRAATGFGVIVPSEEFVAHALLYHSPSGQAVWILTPEDEFFYLALHAARHLFSQLIWLYDLKLLLLRNPTLDRSAVWTKARAFSTTNALGLTLQALDHRLGVKVPRDHRFTPRHRLRQRIARTLLRVINSQPPSSRRETVGRILFRLLLCDRPLSSAWYFRHRLLRFVRRRAQRCFPKLTPKRWSA